MAIAAAKKYDEEIEEWKKDLENMQPKSVPEPKLERKISQCDPEKEKLKKFKCDMCDFRAMTSLGVKKHLNKQHPWKERGIDD